MERVDQPAAQESGHGHLPGERTAGWPGAKCFASGRPGSVRVGFEVGDDEVLVGPRCGEQQTQHNDGRGELPA